MTTKEELEIIEKSIGHLTKAVVKLSKLVMKESSGDRATTVNYAKNELLDDIHILTTTIAKMQEPALKYDGECFATTKQINKLFQEDKEAIAKIKKLNHRSK